MDYSADQLAAIHGLQDFITQPFEPIDCERVLTGSAGTGKTSVVKALVESDPGPIILSALTHQAAKVLADIAKREVQTLASALGLRVVIDPFSGREVLKPGNNGPEVLSDGGTLLIDEAGMLGSSYEEPLSHAIRDFNLKVIYVGDKYQLPPVNEVCSVFDSEILEFELTTTHRFDRHAEILDTATQWRDAQESIGSLPRIKETFSINILDRARFNAQSIAAADDFQGEYYGGNLVVCYTNKGVHQHNRRIRQAVYDYGPDDPYESGEQVTLNSPLTDPRSGDLIAHTGTLLDVQGVEPSQLIFQQPGPHTNVTVDTWAVSAWDDLRSYHVPQDPAQYKAVLEQLKQSALNTPPHAGKLRKRRWWAYYRALRSIADLRPTFARTVHKTQGSTVDHVFVDASDFKFAREKTTIARLMYVALTRARESVFITGLKADGSVI